MPAGDSARIAALSDDQSWSAITQCSDVHTWHVSSTPPSKIGTASVYSFGGTIIGGPSSIRLLCSARQLICEITRERPRCFQNQQPFGCQQFDDDVPSTV